MLTPYVRRQLIIFVGLSVVAVLVLGVYYLQIPTLVGIGRYTLKADLSESGGLYKTANVTYRGITVGKVTDIEPTEQGAQAKMSIDSRYKIPDRRDRQRALGVGGRRAVPRPEFAA